MSNSCYLLTGCSDSTVVLWDIKNRSISKTLEVEEESEQLCMLMGEASGALLPHDIVG